MVDNDVESPGATAAGQYGDVSPFPSSPREDSSVVDVEKLGRRRPASFRHGWTEVGFCVSVLGSMMIAEFLVSGFNGKPILGVDASCAWPQVFSALKSPTYPKPSRLPVTFRCPLKVAMSSG